MRALNHDPNRDDENYMKHTLVTLGGRPAPG